MPKKHPFSNKEKKKKLILQERAMNDVINSQLEIHLSLNKKRVLHKITHFTKKSTILNLSQLNKTTI